MAGETMTVSLDDWKKHEERAKKVGELAKRSTEWSFLQLGKHESMIKALAVGGIGAFVLFNKSWSDKIPGMKDAAWYLKPLALLGVAYYAYYKKSPWAQPLFILAAALFVLSYQRNSWNKENAALAAQLATAKYPEVGSPYDVEGSWVKTGMGGEVFQPAGGTDAPANFADRVFSNARAAG